ncbi:MAG: MFS transporter [Parasphingorhabdus sp.]|uniref:MFS transporter n=1 Tax=Parasphingorhabdus sp. TaxID=2709688 RepID=UPI00329919CD
MSALTDPLPTKTKILYGFGSIAYGIKDNGFATFLLFYYNQVVGLRADLVGLAIAIALIADAFIDPLIGRMTDRTHTRIGRRHPWLYASAVPIAATWLLLWHPPEASETVQFFYLLTLAMLVRFSLSLNEVPALAMLPELSRDYHDRTSITRFRYLFGWGSGLSIMALAYSIFLAPTDEHPVGLLNPDGYSKYAIVGSIFMSIAVLVAASSTHKRIVGAYHDSKSKIQASDTWKQMFDTLRYRPFLLLLLAGVFAFTNQGVVFALNTYLLPHVWQLDQNGLFLFAMLLFIAAVIAFVFVTPISQRFGKARSASVFTLIAMVLGTAPYWLRAMDLFPEPGSPALIPTLFTFLILGTSASICAMILTTSLMADVTDAYEHEHGRRSEGVFASGVWFMQKTVGALGILFASLIIALVQLPEKATPGTVDIAIIDRLSLVFASLTVVIALIGAWAYTLFPLDEKDHQARLDEQSKKPMPAE